MKHKLPLITVYITNYNYGRYIAQSITSVLNQTYQNFELIIIDDGSVDNSKKIINQFSKNKKIRVVFQKNKGLIISNNIAIKLCRGEYIVRLDADDWLDVNFLQIMTNHITKTKDCAMVFCNYYETNIKGEVVKHFYRHEFKKVKLLDQPAHGACSLINVKILKELGGYDNSFNCQDGVDLWLKIINKYKVKNVNLPLFFYRQHNRNLTKNFINVLKNRNKILKKHSQNKKKKLSILAVIPVRGANYGETLLALKKIKNKPIIHNIIHQLQKVFEIKKIIVSTPDEKIINNIKKVFKKKIIVDKREEKLSRINTPINQTLKSILKKIKKNALKFDFILVVNVVCPFLNSNDFESAINIAKIFNTDEVIAIKKESDNFYKHDGNGLKLVQKNINLSLEREEVYREIGGLRLVKISKIGKINNIIGHIFLDEKSSFRIKNNQDIILAKAIAQINNLI